MFPQRHDCISYRPAGGQGIEVAFRLSKESRMRLPAHPLPGPGGLRRETAQQALPAASVCDPRACSP